MSVAPREKGMMRAKDDTDSWTWLALDDVMTSKGDVTQHTQLTK